MDTKVFVEADRFRLVGDERDVTVPACYRAHVWKWCQDSGITCEYQGSLNGIDLWRVTDQKQRSWFMLRWL